LFIPLNNLFAGINDAFPVSPGKYGREETGNFYILFPCKAVGNTKRIVL
jgi:hypothetical protein